ncbi:hypothetical protein ACG5V6_21565 [Streptomyces chitinivorans]|uniref:Uncharacterized protein n=1 Tax=Streptomyces chitinivorans TaxID=1257027 RepID=A0ABW7HYY1_9ACTN|nr:hypothetical protein [Streptomyces chitinivorans]MDH2412130.1 hypothetical protein [Streptomyces chitinivorans]
MGGNRRLILAGALLGALLLLAGGLLWTGGDDEPQAEEGLRLREVCDGVLPEREARAVLGEGPLMEDISLAQGGSGFGTSGLSPDIACAVTRRLPEKAWGLDAGRIEVTVHGATVPGSWRENWSDLPLPGTYVSAPAPLAGGWTGFFAIPDPSVSDHKGLAAVFLDCVDDNRALLVTVRGKKDGAYGFDDPAHRTVLARLATATARKAAGRWGCKARFGERLRTVPLPVADDEDVPLEEADGTCEGVPARGRTFARAWESNRGGAPQEMCSVGNSGGTPLYALRAFYGPYATSARAAWRDWYSSEETTPGRAPSGKLPEGGLWATATCPAPFAGETALFAIEPLDREREKSTREEQAYERAALKAFAEASAEHHGCSAPRLP